MGEVMPGTCQAQERRHRRQGQPGQPGPPGRKTDSYRGGSPPSGSSAAPWGSPMSVGPDSDGISKGDWVETATLQLGLEQDQVMDLLEEFMEEALKKISMLYQLDTQHLQSSAHWIKSTSVMFGMASVTTVGKAIEDECKACQAMDPHQEIS